MGTTTRSTTTTPEPIVFTTLANGLCSIKGYKRYQPRFDAASYDMVNPGLARIQFQEISNQFGIVSRKWNRIGCARSAHQVPCEYIDLPAHEEGCQMVGRIGRLFNHIMQRCNNKWNGIHRPKMALLLTVGQAASGRCGEKSIQRPLIDMTEVYSAFGVTPPASNNMLMDAKAVKEVEEVVEEVAEEVVEP